MGSPSVRCPEGCALREAGDGRLLRPALPSRASPASQARGVRQTSQNQRATSAQPERIRRGDFCSGRVHFPGLLEPVPNLCNGSQGLIDGSPVEKGPRCGRGAGGAKPECHGDSAPAGGSGCECRSELGLWE